MAKPKKQEPVKKEIIIEQTAPIESLMAEPKRIIETDIELPKELAVEDEPKTLYTSKLYLVNPFTGDVFIPGQPTEATLDSWLQSQIDAGLCQ